MGSIITGVAGVFATWAALTYLEKGIAGWNARHFWLLGLAGLFPAWLSAFLGLLQPLAGGAADVPLPPRALFSSGAALCGIIVTDYLLRRLQRSGRVFRPVTYWIIGSVALLPAWCIALVRFFP